MPIHPLTAHFSSERMSYLRCVIEEAEELASREVVTIGSDSELHPTSPRATEKPRQETPYILVVGPPLSGKKTLAKLISERLGIRVLHCVPSTHDFVLCDGEKLSKTTFSIEASDEACLEHGFVMVVAAMTNDHKPVTEGFASCSLFQMCTKVVIIDATKEEVLANAASKRRDMETNPWSFTHGNFETLVRSERRVEMEWNDIAQSMRFTRAVHPDHKVVLHKFGATFDMSTIC